jgi:hypothetical protein
MDAAGGRIIYRHGKLPPFDAEVMGEHIVEATPGRVPGRLAHRRPCRFVPPGVLFLPYGRLPYDSFCCSEAR